jgi:hypothetical protein
MKRITKLGLFLILGATFINPVDTPSSVVAFIFLAFGGTLFMWEDDTK